MIPGCYEVLRSIVRYLVGTSSTVMYLAGISSTVR